MSSIPATDEASIFGASSARVFVRENIMVTMLARSMLVALIAAALAVPVAAHEEPDPSIKHNARDGIVRLYGAGGPDTAFKKVAAVFKKETGIYGGGYGRSRADVVKKGSSGCGHPMGHR